MIELLAIPGWQTAPLTLKEWVDQLTERSGAVVSLDREPEGIWIVLASLRLRGFALLAGPHVEAINFELNDPDPAKATSLLEAAAAALAWEIHPDDDDDEDDEED